MCAVSGNMYVAVAGNIGQTKSLDANKEAKGNMQTKVDVTYVKDNALVTEPVYMTKEGAAAYEQLTNNGYKAIEIGNDGAWFSSYSDADSQVNKGNVNAKVPK